ncbi:uncharacterized protein METZ01_LOCUS179477 [marine metagenome]|uniref:Uncharacterized protein n=1 Tax=marine metagenome TaxID=408172 RepID=A0A382CMV6_9ZZZZ
MEEFQVMFIAVIGLDICLGPFY